MGKLLKRAKKGKKPYLLTVGELTKILQEECQPDWGVYFYGEQLTDDREEINPCDVDTGIEARVEFNIPLE